MRIVRILLVLFTVVSCQEPENGTVANQGEFVASSITSDPIFHASHEAKKATAPFSDAVQVGNLFFLSGQIGMDHKERVLVEGGIAAETKQTLENIKAVLKQHGLEMRDVVKAMVVLDNIEDFAAFNAVYKSYFPQKPARTTFAAQALAAGAKIEIEVIAVQRDAVQN